MRTTTIRAETLVVDLDGTCTLSRREIGGKAWSINRMRALGLPVPPAFAITTDGCADFYASGRVLAEQTWRRVRDGMAALERGTGRGFGSATRPLLVSVRSGAAVSMPGMMDTVLNLGMNDIVERALAEESGNDVYARDTRRRFIEQYREIVLGDPAGIVTADPWEQLRAAIMAVFASWESARARIYRRNQGVTDTLGTAVTVQAMVFGNLDERSGTGVLFSRNPNTGHAPAWGEWLAGGQGEDVVSGRVTPRPLDELAVALPSAHRQLLVAAERLERDGGDVQDIEFTIESGTLWLLQARPAKRSARAALRAAVAMVDEGLIEPSEAARRITVEQVRAVLRPELSRTGAAAPLAHGEPACHGAASGVVVTDPDEAERRADAGEDVILVRPTTSPDDLHGMIAARAVVTELGGATSHAAVVSREFATPCVVGCGPGTVASLAGKEVTVDGDTGTVWPGRITGQRVSHAALADLARVAGWLGVEFTGEAHLPGLLAALEHPVSAHPSQQGTAVPQPPALAVLRIIGIKGRVQPDAIADSLGVDLAQARSECDALVAAGHCASTPAGLRITASGRERLARLLDEERAAVDAAAVSEAYLDFCAVNSELKEIITAWQMKDAATPNDHTDPGYDGAVLERLADLHHRVMPLVKRLGGVVPRLARYTDRLEHAQSMIADGDHSWVARPIMDSYHTVWFELHEDLISLCGRTRADEAAAGRAH